MQEFKTLRQHVNDHPDIKRGDAVALIYYVEDVMDLFPGEVTVDEAREVLRQLDKGAAGAAIVAAMEGLV